MNKPNLIMEGQTHQRRSPPPPPMIINFREKKIFRKEMYADFAAKETSYPALKKNSHTFINFLSTCFSSPKQ